MKVNFLQSFSEPYSWVPYGRCGVREHKPYHQVLDEPIIVEDDAVIIVHPRKCYSEYCKSIIDRMSTCKKENIDIENKKIYRQGAYNKWLHPSLLDCNGGVVHFDAPFAINKLGDIQYAERYDGFFKGGQVVHPAFNEEFKPEKFAEYGWNYMGQDDHIQTYLRHSAVYPRSTVVVALSVRRIAAESEGLRKWPEVLLVKSAMDTPVFLREGVPVEGAAAKVLGADIYLITPSSNKKKLDFNEYTASQLAEVKRGCWLLFAKNEVNHETIETFLKDWKKIHPLFEKMNIFTETLDCVLHEVLERIKMGGYWNDNQESCNAEGGENIRSAFSHCAGSVEDKSCIPPDDAPPYENRQRGTSNGSSTFNEHIDSRASDEKTAENLKKVKQFLEMIRPDLEQLVLIDKRRECVQVNSCMSDFLRLCVNNENKCLAARHLTLINEKCLSMSISSPSDIASVIYSVFQGSKEIPVLGDKRTELLVKAKDVVFLISDLLFKI